MVGRALTTGPVPSLCIHSNFVVVHPITTHNRYYDRLLVLIEIYTSIIRYLVLESGDVIDYIGIVPLLSEFHLNEWPVVDLGDTK